MKGRESMVTKLAIAARAARLDRIPLAGGIVRRAGRALNQYAYGTRGVPAMIDGQVQLRLSPRVFSGGGYDFDPSLTRELLSLVGDGADFLDCGAHLGIASLIYASAVQGTPRILAVEPNPAVYPLLVENVSVNRANIQTLPLALGDRIGSAEIFFNGRDTNASLSHDAPGKYWFWADKEKPVMQGSPVTITTVDAICAALDFRPGLIKIDVEGAELQLLNGARRTLQRDRPRMLLETHVFAWNSFGYHHVDLERSIRDAGYVVLDSGGTRFTGRLGSGPQTDNNHYILEPL